MLRLAAISAAGLSFVSLSGCSRLVTLVVLNNSGSPVEACNLNSASAPCARIPPGGAGEVLLVGDQAAPSWRLRITASGSESIYEFNLSSDPQVPVYCERKRPRGCWVSLQLESDGLLYWAGEVRDEAIDSLPPQPSRFPVAAGTA